LTLTDVVTAADGRTVDCSIVSFSFFYMLSEKSSCWRALRPI